MVNGAWEAARNDHDAIVLKPLETWPAAAEQLVLAAREAVVDPDRPHASEAVYFWRYVTKRQLIHLFARVRQFVLPNPIDCVNVNSRMLNIAADMAAQFHSLRVEFYNSLG